MIYLIPLFAACLGVSAIVSHYLWQRARVMILRQRLLGVRSRFLSTARRTGMSEDSKKLGMWAISDVIRRASDISAFGRPMKSDDKSPAGESDPKVTVAVNELNRVLLPDFVNILVEHIYHETISGYLLIRFQAFMGVIRAQERQSKERIQKDIQQNIQHDFAHPAM